MNRTFDIRNNRVLRPENVFTALALIAAIAAAAASQYGLEKGWRATTGTAAPISPDTKNATWVESLTWGIVTGAIIGVVRVLSLQGASSFRRAWK